MKIKSEVLRYIHLDKASSQLTFRSVKILLEWFRILDVHGKSCLNDIQFLTLMLNITDLSKERIYNVFDILDVDASGELDFDEFYLLTTILVAVQDGEEKQFIFQHSRTVFDLLDEDGSGAISGTEFEKYGFLFSFEGKAVQRIFQEFDVSGDQELDYREFRMFAMACIDKQIELKLKEKRRLEKSRERRQRFKSFRFFWCWPSEESKFATEIDQARIAQKKLINKHLRRQMPKMEESQVYQKYLL